MNRTIKFRGLTKDKPEEWVYGWYCVVLGYHYIIPNDADIVGIKFPNTYGLIGSIEVIPETVGQFTGLKDKQGIKIWDGDIVKYTLLDADSAVGKTYEMDFVMEWNEKTCCFQISDMRYHPMGTHQGKWGVAYLGNLVEKIKIIGNIHETPKLLEKENADCKKG